MIPFILFADEFNLKDTTLVGYPHINLGIK